MKGNISSTSRAIETISKMKKASTGAKTGLGRFINSTRNTRFQNKQIKAIKELGLSLPHAITKSVTSLGSQLIASETAKELNSPSSYRGGLSAWSNAFSGNPDKQTGNDGENQNGSISELGG